MILFIFWNKNKRPLIIPSRDMDVVFAVDARSDCQSGNCITGNGCKHTQIFILCSLKDILLTILCFLLHFCKDSNGTSIYNTYLKSQLPEYVDYPFPK